METHGDVKEVTKLCRYQYRLLSAGQENTLEGLLVLRQAWDLIDIGRYVLKGYKMAAKVCYMVLILLAIAITAVSIEKDSLNADKSPQ